jgi:hypothetical protein
LYCIVLRINTSLLGFPLHQGLPVKMMVACASYHTLVEQGRRQQSKQAEAGASLAAPTPILPPPVATSASGSGAAQPILVAQPGAPPVVAQPMLLVDSSKKEESHKEGNHRAVAPLHIGAEDEFAGESEVSESDKEDHESGVNGVVVVKSDVCDGAVPAPKSLDMVQQHTLGAAGPPGNLRAVLRGLSDRLGVKLIGS